MQSINYIALKVGPVFDTIKNFVDRIFSTPKSLLDLAREKLVNANQVTARGINLKSYLHVLGDMPNEWQRVITSVLIGIVVIMGLLLFRALMRLYYAAKDGIKYW